MAIERFCITIAIFLCVHEGGFRAIGAQSFSTSIFTELPEEPYNTTISEIPTTVHAKNIVSSGPRKFRKLVTDAMSEVSSKLMRAAYQELDPFSLNISTTCMRHVLLTTKALRKQKLWAIKLMFANGGIPEGMFSGTFTSFGDYHGCQRVNASGLFMGKYCIVETFPEKSFLQNNLYDIYSRDDSKEDKIVRQLSDTIAKYDTFLLKNVPAVRTGICIPSTCSRHDVNVIVAKGLEIAELNWTIHASHCWSSNDEEELPTEVFGSLCAFAILFAIIGLSSLLELCFTFCGKIEHIRAHGGILVRLLLCFSMPSNAKMVLKPERKGSSIAAFHGLKVVACCWVVLIHVYMTFLLGFSGHSTMNFREWLKSYGFTFIANGNQAVSAFFFISGVLLMYRGASRNSNDKSSSSGATDIRNHFIVQILRRLWRLMPSIMAVIAMTFVLNTVIYGPAAVIIKTFTGNCKYYWWRTLFFLSNYTDPDEICLPWLWYTSADAQLFTIGAIVFIIIRKYPRIAYWILGLLTVIGIIAIAGTVVAYNLPPVHVMSIFGPPAQFSAYVRHSLTPSHMYLIPLSAGLTVGYFLSKNPKLRLSKWLSITCWLSAAIIFLAALTGIYPWHQGVAVPSIFISALYGCSAKLAIALSLSWLAVACCTGNGGFINAFLSHPVFVVLGRLSFMAYLIHPLFQSLYLGTSTSLLPVDQMQVFVVFCGTLVFSYGAGFFCCIWFELPCVQIDKLVFSPRTTNTFVNGNKEGNKETIEELDSKELRANDGNKDMAVKCTKLEMTD